MKMPNPKATTTTEAYLAYKAGVIAEAELKPKLYHPYIHLDGWLAYWCGLVDTYPTDKNGDPECLTDEEAYIAYLANVTNAYPLNLKDPADPRVAGYLRYLIAAKFGRPNYPVTREEFYLSIMKPPVVPSGDPSSSIELEGTVEAPFISLEAYGDTSQATYTGKNKLNPFLGYPAGATFTSFGVTYTLNGDGTFTVNGTSTGDSYWNFNNSVLVDGTGMKLVIEIVDGQLDDPNRLFIRAYSDNTGANYRGTSVAYDARVSSSTEMAATDYLIIRLAVSNGNTVNNVRVRVMMVPVDATTDYEPYVGGISSPNPDYPQEVKTVTGRQVVAITDGDGENAEYELNLGKNLATTNSGTNNFFIGKIKKGETYTLSFDLLGDIAVGGAINLKYGWDGVTIYAFYNPQKGHKTVTFTASNTANLYYNAYGDGSASGADNIQLEKGTEATSYAPYFEPIELCKIGDYQDYIYRDLAGNWKIHKEISSYTFTGQEGWTKHPNGSFYSSNNLYGSLGGALPASNTDVAAVISDAFIASTYSSFDHSSAGQICINSDGTNNPRIAASGYNSSTNTFTGMLASKRPKLYYALAEATDEELTNEELIAQLDALMEGGSYEGTTYITVSSEDLPALLKVEAAKDV